MWVMGDDAFPRFRQKFVDPDSWHSKQVKAASWTARVVTCASTSVR